jgi:sugar O-acyltransferase (sialic acid O-acetyltransferase NeuD family)
MKPVWVLGAGGHAKVVIDTLRATGAWDVVGLLDDDGARWGTEYLAIPVEGEISDQLIGRFGVEFAVIAIGSNYARAKIATRLTHTISWVNAIHPTAHLASGVRLGVGCVVCSGTIVQPDAVIGDHAILNTMCSVDHDGIIGKFAHIGPGAHLGGNVKVGEGALLGVGSCVAPGRMVGAWAMVGAGAAVVNDIPKGVTAMGVPARFDVG